MNPVKRALLSIAAPVLAIVIAGVVASGLLLSTGDDVAAFWSTMLQMPGAGSWVDIFNATAALYLSGILSLIHI